LNVNKVSPFFIVRAFFLPQERKTYDQIDFRD
jgi:hypothetical protein